MVLALNTVSGQIADVSPKMLLHPKFKDILEVVEVGQKPYLPEMFLSGTVDERSEKKTYSLKEVFSALKEEEEVVDEKLDTIDNNEEDK
jgi:hypothetical protein